MYFMLSNFKRYAQVPPSPPIRHIEINVAAIDLRWRCCGVVASGSSKQGCGKRWKHLGIVCFTAHTEWASTGIIKRTLCLSLFHPQQQTP